jgi:hypothetical protein
MRNITLKLNKMGCHTWFFKKTDKSAKELFYETNAEFLSELKRGEWDDDLNFSDLVEVKDFYKRVERWLEKEWINKAIAPILNGLFIYYKDSFYESSSDLPHDIFRTNENCKYSNEILDSLEATLDFIKKNNIIIDQDQKK